MRTVEQIWDDGRRAYVIECLECDEFPYQGWDKHYPDLAQQRLREVAEGKHEHAQPAVGEGEG